MATLHIKLPCIQQNQNTNTPYKIQVEASNSEARGWLAIPPVLDGSWYIQNIRMCKITDLSVLLYQLPRLFKGFFFLKCAVCTL